MKKQLKSDKKLLFEMFEKVNPNVKLPTINEEEDKWIQKAVNPEHKGYCTPMTKPTCTPKRKALAKRFKKGIENEAYGTPDPLGSAMAKPIKEDVKVVRTHEYQQGLQKAIDQIYAQLIFDGMKPDEAVNHIMSMVEMTVNGLRNKS
jgi:hypothetical protein